MRSMHKIPILLTLALAVMAGPLFAETRVALIIGNGDYTNVPLKNPPNDAQDLAKALKDLGFSINLVVNGDLIAMNRAIRDFGNAIKRPDAIALFYYSGHGIQYQGANYLIPAKADIQDADELSYAAINAEAVYSKMQSAGDKTNIIILDACRNNPFPGTERSLERGLAVVGTIQPPQSLIVYATAPGKTAQDGEGKNGVFTSALLRHIADPGIDVELMIRRVREEVMSTTGGAQVPWNNSSIAGAGFAFAGGGRLRVSTAPAGAEVYVDGQMKGVSPVSLADLPRFSEFEVSARNGNKSGAQRITLKDAEEQKLDLILEVARGDIFIKASEKQYSALVDGQTAAVDASGLIKGIDAGSHTLELKGDSSSFKGKVEVGAGKTATVEANLVPMGSLMLSLPQGAVCLIEGMGLRDTTSVFNYGALPAGKYSLTASGGDFEPFSATVLVERGKATNFSPRLRYSLDYLNAKYEAAIARSQAVVDSGGATQADIDETAILAKKIRAEARTELIPLATRVDEIKAKLEALRPAQGGTNSSSLGARGPAQLYASYSAELEELRNIEHARMIDKDDQNNLSTYLLKVQAQPYGDFQELASQAIALQAHYQDLLYQAYADQYDSLNYYLEMPWSANAGLEIAADLLAKVSIETDPRCVKLVEAIKAINVKLGVAFADYQRKEKIDELTSERVTTQEKYSATMSRRKSSTAWGTTLFATGALGAASSLIFSYLAVSTYGKYSGASTSADAASYRDQVEQYNLYSTIALSAGGGIAGIGSIILMTRPRMATLQQAIDSLDKQIHELGGAE
jgi:hypothetical protein